VIIRSITEKEKEAYNAVVSHPLQSYEWGEFREKSGIKIIRRGFFDGDTIVSGFTVTIHRIPHTPWRVGYLPKGDLPDEELLNALQRIGKEENCIFMQLEPNVIQHQEFSIQHVLHNSTFILRNSIHPLFTKYTFQLDLTKTEEELLKDMHPKTRYNIKVAKKHGVEVVEDNSKQAFDQYWQLMQETTKRQKFYAHTKHYHELLWKTVGLRNEDSGMRQEINKKIPDSTDTLTYHLFIAKYQGKILTAMIFFIFHDTLYYPYGASSNEYRNVMHSTLTMWEAIRFGKQLGLKKFDMWGAMGSDSNPNDPWFGFHEFKRKFGARHVEFVGSFDLVIHPLLYQGYKVADKLRWLYLKMKK